MRDDALGDADLLGMPPEQLASLKISLEGGDYNGVWVENLGVVYAFLLISTQWRMATVADRAITIGLDYAGAKVALDAAEVEMTPDLWGDLQVMEVAAINERNRRAVA